MLLDVETLFGNIDEVIEMSQKLLMHLEGGTSGKDFDEQIIGKVRLSEIIRFCFVFLCMVNVYSAE